MYALRLGNGGVAAELCLDKSIWPHLPKEVLTQWWGGPQLCSQAIFVNREQNY